MAERVTAVVLHEHRHRVATRLQPRYFGEYIAVAVLWRWSALQAAFANDELAVHPQPILRIGCNLQLCADGRKQRKLLAETLPLAVGNRLGGGDNLCIATVARGQDCTEQKGSKGSKSLHFQKNIFTKLKIKPKILLTCRRIEHFF